MIKLILFCLMALVSGYSSVNCNKNYSETEEAALFVIPIFDRWAFIFLSNNKNRNNFKSPYWNSMLDGYHHHILHVP